MAQLTLETKMKLIDQYITNKQTTINQIPITNMKGYLYAIPSHKSTLAQVNGDHFTSGLHLQGCPLSKDDFNNPATRSEVLRFTINDSHLTIQKRRNTMEHPEVLPGGRNAKNSINNNNSNNKISQPMADEPMAQKRSNVMKHLEFSNIACRSVFALLAMVLIATMAFGQGNLIVNDNSNYAGTGTYDIKKDIVTTGLTVDKTIGASGSKVYLSRNGAQAIGAATPGRTLTFYTLEAQTGNTKTQGCNVTVNTGFDIKNASTFAVADRTLTLAGTVATTSGTLTTAASSVVDYYAGAQAIISTAYNGTLQLTAGAKTLAGAVTANALNQTGGSITIGSTLGITTTAAFQTITDLTSTLTLGTGAATIATLSNNSAGTIQGGAGTLGFTGAAINGAGSILGAGGAVSFSSTLGNSGTVTSGSGGMAFTGAVTRTAGAISSSAGLLNFNNNVTGTGGTLALTGTGSAQFAGTLDATGVSFATGTSVTYDGTSADQIIADVNYGNLTLTGSTKKWTLSAARTINNNLDIQGSSEATVDGNFDLNVTGNISLASNLLKSANAVVFASASSAVSGNGYEIVGSVTRTHTFASQAYTFNNAATTVNPTANPTNLTSFTMTLAKTNPTDYSATHTIGRTYTKSFVNGGGAFTATIRLGYLSGEVGGANESRLREFNNGISKTKVLTGTYTRNTTSGFSYVDLAGIASTSLTDATQLALDDRFYEFRSLAASTAWNLGTTWDQSGATPTSADDVIIDNNNPVIIPDGLTANALSVTIEATSTSLTVGGGTSGVLNIGTGGLTNNSTGTGLAVNANAAVTITGGDLTNNGTVTNNGTITVQ